MEIGNQLLKKVPLQIRLQIKEEIRRDGWNIKKSLNEQYEDFRQLIVRSFIWDRTRKGHHYWNRIANKYNN
jgi:hypothetical protein